MIASVIFACVEKHSAGCDVGGCPDWLQSIVPNDDFGYSDWLDQVMASNETVADTESVPATVSFEDADCSVPVSKPWLLARTPPVGLHSLVADVHVSAAFRHAVHV